MIETLIILHDLCNSFSIFDFIVKSPPIITIRISTFMKETMINNRGKRYLLATCSGVNNEDDKRGCEEEFAIQ